MAWKKVLSMDERARFVLEVEKAEMSVAELCRRYSVSRKTGYKWIRRYRVEGLDGIRERSSRPNRCPHKTNPEWEERIILERVRHSSWGPKKIRELLKRKGLDGRVPQASTIRDIYSRYVLEAKALGDQSYEEARGVFERVFEEYGLPEVIRSDNGKPFASRGAGGLSKLSVWWVLLGIKPEFIAKGHPEQNGVHERMHLTL